MAAAIRQYNEEEMLRASPLRLSFIRTDSPLYGSSAPACPSP
ncbi:hypothetical protein KNP414_07243 [Paenibacillus mucilaginosus KNP414]|uniref:Uncharacterized protein n=1 Tax=Paenibacillus mucilaginosus (strain KNP414) TaxID=1036673 RepID=F8FN83_PAEMK|nr:hypothetical protein KNP414_07243 [Paenibacillus mucilaginosus KNP414]